jgi:hypothetical protein
MASSLDEAQPYDFFQEELEKKMKLYSNTYYTTPVVRYLQETFVEFVSFNKFLTNEEELTQDLCTEYEDWMTSYNSDTQKDLAKKVALDFVCFVKRNSK